MKAVLNAKAVRTVADWIRKNKWYFEGGNPAYSSLKIELKPNAYRLIALDGYRLIVVEGYRDGDGEDQLIVDATSLRHQIRKSDRYFVLDTDTAFAYVSKADPCLTGEISDDEDFYRATIVLRPAAGEFPDWKKVVDPARQAVKGGVVKDGLSIRAGYIEEAGKAIRQIAGSGGYELHFSVRSSVHPICLWSNIFDERLSVQMFIMPVRSEEGFVKTFMPEGDA